MSGDEGVKPDRRRRPRYLAVALKNGREKSVRRIAPKRANPSPMQWEYTMGVTVRNTITNDRVEVVAAPGRSVQDAVRESGFVHGDFSVRDKDGNVVDSQPISE